MSSSADPSPGADLGFDYEAALEACARGERPALRALYERESRWLLGVAQRIVQDQQVAHDVLHDAFVLIWERAQTYKRTLGSARGWIYTVVRHRALDIVRRSGRETAAGDAIDQLADDHAGPVELPGIDARDAARLDGCLRALEGRRRTCIVFAFVEGYSHDQIAKHLDTPVGTVKSWIRRSLTALKECMS